ncbi:hypothetical protein [Parasitella parasitica]|uniref:Reverse transcriptase domain-containing protein n=1 Tax=Parasitella parasitica TaxID=35722 RepID=A0A0B7MVW6_9FUNG|nr:hypothetical protein [Parasitella parasitica]
MEHAPNTGSSCIGLLLDQEKTYNCVHPIYLYAVFLRFGFLIALVDSISHLFFDTHLVVKVNGFLSPRVPQLRGLKQSPILFSLALEPLLRKIFQGPQLSGYQLLSPQALKVPLAVKMVAFTRQHPTLRRTTIKRHNERSWLLLFKAIDCLPKDFSNTVASASTRLEVPLASVILLFSSSVELGRSLAQLPSSVAYAMGSDPDSCLRSKQSTLSPFFVRAFIPSRCSSLGRFPFLLVEDHTVVDVSPFVESLSICSSRGTAMSTKFYRRLCLLPIAAKPSLPPPLNPDISRHLPFLSAPWTSVNIRLLLTTVRFAFPQPTLLAIATTVESIWTSHWFFIFSDTPFTLNSVLSLVESKFLRYRQESFLAAGIPHCAPAVFSVD